MYLLGLRKEKEQGGLAKVPLNKNINLKIKSERNNVLVPIFFIVFAVQSLLTPLS